MVALTFSILEPKMKEEKETEEEGKKKKIPINTYSIQSWHDMSNSSIYVSYAPQYTYTTLYPGFNFSTIFILSLFIRVSKQDRLAIQGQKTVDLLA